MSATIALNSIAMAPHHLRVDALPLDMPVLAVYCPFFRCLPFLRLHPFEPLGFAGSKRNRTEKSPCRAARSAVSRRPSAPSPPTPRYATSAWSGHAAEHLAAFVAVSSTFPDEPFSPAQDPRLSPPDTPPSRPPRARCAPVRFCARWMASRSTSERRKSRRPLTVRIDGKRPLSDRTRTESAESPSTRAASLGVRRSSGIVVHGGVLVPGSGLLEQQARDVTTSTNPARAARGKSGASPIPRGPRSGTSGPGLRGEPPEAGTLWRSLREGRLDPGGCPGPDVQKSRINFGESVIEVDFFPPQARVRSPGPSSTVRGKHRMRHPVHALFRVTALAALLALPGARRSPTPPPIRTKRSTRSRR